MCLLVVCIQENVPSVERSLTQKQLFFVDTVNSMDVDAYIFELKLLKIKPKNTYSVIIYSTLCYVFFMSWQV